MKYEQVIEMIREAALSLEGIKSFFYGDILRLNKNRDWEYPMIALTPRITTTRDGFYQFGFTLWYIDIEDDDRRDIRQIQSDAIEQLTSLTLLLDEHNYIGISYAPIIVFANRFNDICAGATCDLTITVQADTCPPKPIFEYNLIYHIEGATPETVTKIYTQGTLVILETPKQLGMTLPNGYTFLGWQIDGQTVTEIVMNSDKVVIGNIIDIPIDGLLFWYDFSKGSNVEPTLGLQDLSGNNRHLTARYTFTWDGITNGYIDDENGRGLLFDKSVRTLVWRRIAFQEPIDTFTLFVKRKQLLTDTTGGSAAGDFYTMDIRPTQWATGNNVWFESREYVNGSGQRVRGGGQWVNGERRVNVQGNSMAGFPSLISWMDSTQYNSIPLDITQPDNPDIPPLDMAFGGVVNNINLNPTTSGGYFNSMVLYEAIMYNRVLSEKERAQVLDHLNIQFLKES